MPSSVSMVLAKVVAVLQEMLLHDTVTAGKLRGSQLGGEGLPLRVNVNEIGW